MPKVSDAHLRARRQQILDAAAACFAREGFHRTSMQDIVRECGVSAGLVYRYFASKDEMIAAIVGECHAHRALALSAAPADGPAAAADGSAGRGPADPDPAPASAGTLDQLADGYLGLLRELGQPGTPDGRLALQVWAESVRSAEIRGLARQGVDEPRAAVGALLRGRLPADLDPDALVRVMIAVYQGLIVQSVWDDTLDRTAFVDTVAAIVRRLLPTPPARKRPGSS